MIGDPNGELIASVMGRDDSGFYVKESQIDPNARLIAAAPQLVEWVRELSAEVERLREGHTNSESQLRGKCDEIGTLLTTIAAQSERIAALEKDAARAGNYVCDREVEPHMVTFNDGRVVCVVGDGYLEIEKVS